MDVVSQIESTAQAYGVDPTLAYEVAIQESGANIDAPIGAAGEIGIYQLEPATAAMLGVDPTDPVQNITGAISYLAQLLGQFGGDVSKALAAYNDGPGNVAGLIGKYGANWFVNLPGSTKNYVNTIMANVQTNYSSDVAGPQLTSAVAGISLSTIAWMIGAAIFAILAFD